MRCTVDRALRSYLALREVAKQSDRMQPQLVATLELLQQQLGECARDASSGSLRKLDATITWLRDRHQAVELTATLRALYLRPKFRVYVSQRLLNAVTDFPLPVFPHSSNEDGVQLTGSVSTAGRLRVATCPQEAFADLTLRFADPVVFAGTVQARTRLPGPQRRHSRWM